MDTPVILRALPTSVAPAHRGRRGGRLLLPRPLARAPVSLAFNTVPVQRKGPIAESPAALELDRLIDEGWSLLVFAEGTRSRDGTVGRLRSGAAVLAAEHGLAIVPVHVSGTHAVMPPGRSVDAPRARTPAADRGPLRSADPAARRASTGPEVMERVRLFFEASGAVTTPDTRVASASAALAVARVFVTGASGFIGGALTARLLERGDEVVGLARSDEAAAVVASRGAEVARGDLLDEDSLAAGMEGCAFAYHVAGVNTHCPADPAMLLRVNVGGAEAMVRAAARARHPAHGVHVVRRVGRRGRRERSVARTRRTGARTSPSTTAPSTWGSRPHSARRSDSGSSSSRSTRRRFRGPAGRPATEAHHRLPQRPAAGVRGHLRERGRHRRHRGGSPARRRARSRRAAVRAERRDDPVRGGAENRLGAVR